MTHISALPCKSPTTICSICPLAKQHRLSFPVSSSRVNKPFELLHADIWGPYRTTPYDGYKLFLSIVDDFSRATWIFLMSHKSNAFSLLESFILFVANQFDAQVKIIRSDNGQEFGDNHAIAFYTSKGIIHQTSCVDTPQQNGIVERKHKQLLEVARALMFQSKVPLKFWGDCVLTATYLVNRLPHSAINFKTPYEVLFSKPPSYEHLKVFGCLCFIFTLRQGRTKFEP